MDSQTIEDNSAAGKKRKNRWGDLDVSHTSSIAEINDPIQMKEDINPPFVNLQPMNDSLKKERKSRWASSEPVAQLSVPSTASVASTISQDTLQQVLVLKLQLQQINEKLVNVVSDALRIEQDPNRSPSPPPKYDSTGKRTNTREVRMRDFLMTERKRIIEETMKLNPQYQAPVDFIKAKPVRRIPIPKQENPLYNYIGLIIGPRGNTQKQMEQDTGCKISIRGKGSSKEGSKGRASKNIDEDEELHVHITGETEENVEKASRMVQDLLRPIDDDINQHKQKQLRELALINGTLREDEYCPVCGEKGHRQFECPHRAKAFKAANVKCAICGDLSHPTRDCPMKQETPASEVALDTEYDSFMAELGEGTSSSAKQSLTGTSNSSIVGNQTTQIAATKPPATVMLAPIVDTLAKKQQTIIHVKTVMTGNAPPVLLSQADVGPCVTEEPANLSTEVSHAISTSRGMQSVSGTAFPIGMDSGGYYAAEQSSVLQQSQSTPMFFPTTSPQLPNGLHHATGGFAPSMYFDPLLTIAATPQTGYLGPHSGLLYGAGTLAPLPPPLPPAGSALVPLTSPAAPPLPPPPPPGAATGPLPSPSISGSYWTF
jgi:hypothetical protein